MAKEQTVVYVASFESRIGPVQIASTEKGVAVIMLPGAPEGEIQRELNKRLPGHTLVWNRSKNQGAFRSVQAVLNGEGKEPSMPLDLRGTPFQKKVWDVLTTIPRGKTLSYKEVAGRIGNPKAVRAIGMACRANPVPLLVPCHRVIGSDGSMTGFGGKQGIPLKRRLLDLER